MGALTSLLRTTVMYAPSTMGVALDSAAQPATAGRSPSAPNTSAWPGLRYGVSAESSANTCTPVNCATSSPTAVFTRTKVSEPEISASSATPASARSPARSRTPSAPARTPTAPAMRFIGGSLNARTTRIDFGRWNTSDVAPYCSSSPASITAA